MSRGERGQLGLRRGLPDKVSHIEREEVAGVEERVDVLEADVVGVDIVRGCPARGFGCGVGFGSNAGGLSADDGVFAKGFVPDRANIDAFGLCLLERAQLSQALAAKTIADAHGEFFDLHEELLLPASAAAKKFGIPRAKIV
ncbi:MAG: hypothetical protein BWZ10_03287 [candidate division BRC1 bacterium ADurb.BinA364]|nr:MAG: hypothetical protein BWZ10_03287 [candidate division BRC1 bacterium ADurb.BinA364]